MLTIREALTLPALSQAMPVAGTNGVDRVIEWVHIVDMPNAQFEYEREGILLLTTGQGLQNDPEAQANLIPKLVAEGFAGLVWSMGHGFDAVPEQIRTSGDEHAFPIITVPPETQFVTISEKILDKITKRQYRLLQRSNTIHKQLTEIVLQGGSIQDLAETLANSINRSITIEDASFRVLASHQIGPIDEARRRSLQFGRTPQDMAKILLDHGIYKKLLKKMGPLHIDPILEAEMPMERVVAPIIVDREIYGYMWIISGDRPFTELDELAMDQAATTAALLMFKEMAVKEATESLQGDFLEKVLSGDIHSVSFSEQAHRLGFRPEKPHQILLIQGMPKAGGNGRSLYENVQKWLHSLKARPLLISRDKRVVLVLQSGDEAGGRQLAEGMIKDLSHPSCPLLIGIGKPTVVKTEPDGLKHSFEQAEEALQIGLALKQQEGVRLFSELGFNHWLYHVPAAQREGNSYLHNIRDLSEYDAKRNTELVKTLESYLDHGGSLVDTAQALYIHRNTLLHRLERIKTLNHLNLRDPLQRLNLHIAIKAFRLNDQP